MKVIDKEQQIAEAFRRGETSAMDDLFALFSGYLMGVGMRYIADDDEVKDVLQETFIKIFTSEQWKKYLRTDFGKMKKARDKRIAKKAGKN